MKIIDQSYEIISLPENLLQTLELAGRTCYKSEDKITEYSADRFVKMLIARGHHAMIEFGSIIVKFITNRGVTHELVRHRLCSFAQESTRYVNYGGDDIVFIRPVWLASDPSLLLWHDAMKAAEASYKDLLSAGWRPEQAREVLPNSLKTEIVVQANIREWRHIFKLRTAPAAHPQMRELMISLLEELQHKLPVVFDCL
jgi:thymidylate synthase (FAD)